jgi:hypothetical protein
VNLLLVYLREHLKDTTRRDYSLIVARFFNWVIEVGLPLALPIPRVVIMLWAAYRADSVGAARISCDISAINAWMRHLGYPDVARSPLTRNLMRGIQRVHGGRTTHRIGASPEVVRALINAEPTNTQRGHCFRMAYVLAFAGLMRSAEYTTACSFRPHAKRCLRLRHITFVPNWRAPRLLRVIVPFGKTDPFGQGRLVVVPSTTWGPGLNPLQIMRDAILFRYGSSQAVRQALASGRDWLLALSPTRALSYAIFRLHLASSLRRLNLDAIGITPHSFRIGGATFLHRAGMSRQDIMRVGGWSSDAIEQYIRLDEDALNAFALRLFAAALPRL